MTSKIAARLHWDILDTKRLDMLPALGLAQSEGFYLAGGTALALLIGHRDSIDFDFFKTEAFDTAALWREAVRTFGEQRLVRTQEEAGTLSLLIDDEVRVSFLHFPYPLVVEPLETDHFPIAAIEDIACMKLNAMTNRKAFKDYVDMYFILKTCSLADIVRTLEKKMPSLDPLLALKSLAYLEDIQEEPIAFTSEPVSLDTMKKEIGTKIAAYLEKLGD